MLFVLVGFDCLQMLLFEVFCTYYFYLNGNLWTQYSIFNLQAMFALKKKKRLEVILKKKSVSLDNLESLLCQLQNSDSEKMVYFFFVHKLHIVFCYCTEQPVLHFSVQNVWMMSTYLLLVPGMGVWYKIAKSIINQQNIAQYVLHQVNSKECWTASYYI